MLKEAHLDSFLKPLEFTEEKSDFLFSKVQAWVLKIKSNVA